MYCFAKVSDVSESYILTFSLYSWYCRKITSAHETRKQVTNVALLGWPEMFFFFCV
jgi:hypothetical protein